MFVKLQARDRYVSLEVSKPRFVGGMIAAEFQWGREVEAKFHQTGIEVRSGTALEINPEEANEEFMRLLDGAFDDSLDDLS